MVQERNDRSRLWKRLAEADEVEMPGPWRRLQLPRVGGLVAAGMDPEGHYLLLVSSSGRGVVDCRSGDRVARDRSPGHEWLDPSRLRAQGIGPLASQEIQIAGSYMGGGLPTVTRDGWALHRAAPTWPKEIVWCESPGEPGFYREGRFHKLWEWDPAFAWGFSESGTAAVIACSNEVRLWTRA